MNTPYTTRGGNRRAQQRRRRTNNRSVPRQPFEYKLIDGNFSNQPYKFCVYHDGYLTRNQYLLHKCNKRKCSQLRCLDWAFKHKAELIED